MNKLVSIFGLVLMLGLFACATVPTPSGRPELKVRLAPEAIELQVVNHYASNWTLQGSDPLGFSIARGNSGMDATGVGSGGEVELGGERIRFNLVPAGEGVTQIRVMATIVIEGTETDESRSRLGLEVQESLEQIFATEAVDGPYIKK
jgi:hypothetical protein